MRTIYSIIIFLFSVVCAFAQTEESNKYFNQGIELYNQGKNIQTQFRALKKVIP